MADTGTGLRQKNLWLEVVSGRIGELARSGRFRDLIQIVPSIQTIGISKVLLGPGVFVGGWKCCPLQLLTLPEAGPELCLRFNSDNEWMALSVNKMITVNDRPVPDDGYVLGLEDEIQISKYRFRIVKRPRAAQETETASAQLDSMMSQSKTNSDPSSDTDFDLKL